MMGDNEDWRLLRKDKLVEFVERESEGDLSDLSMIRVKLAELIMMGSDEHLPELTLEFAQWAIDYLERDPRKEPGAT